jgi:hypothetical protein
VQRADVSVNYLRACDGVAFHVAERACASSWAATADVPKDRPFFQPLEPFSLPPAPRCRQFVLRLLTQVRTSSRTPIRRQAMTNPTRPLVRRNVLAQPAPKTVTTTKQTTIHPERQRIRPRRHRTPPGRARRSRTVSTVSRRSRWTRSSRYELQMPWADESPH